MASQSLPAPTGNEGGLVGSPYVRLPPFSWSQGDLMKLPGGAVGLMCLPWCPPADKMDWNEIKERLG